MTPALAQTDATRQRIDALLGTRDTFVAPEQWTKLGVDAAEILESIAADKTALPSRRARALEGITQIRGVDAADMLLAFANDQNEPAVMRMAAIRGLGRILQPAQLLLQLRPLLTDEKDPSVRGSAAEVLARDAAGSIEARKQGEKESPGWRARFLNEKDAAPISPSPASPSPPQTQPSSRTSAPNVNSRSVDPQPSATSEQTVDLGTINVSSTQLTGFVNLNVPAGTLSIEVFAVAVSDPTSRVVVYRLDSPDGRLWDYANPSGSPMKVNTVAT